MRTRRLLLPSLFLFALLSCLAPNALANGGLNVSARDAVSEDAALRASALKTLREAGPAGLEALFAEFADEIALRAGGQPAAGGAEWARIAEALDAVSQQRDGFASRLYWYTDFEEAKHAARASGKPILSLRLLGKLSEEYSCANSRFFRTVLYANTSVSKFLRDNFVLHWQSVRPAPRVTIDFGDGRRLERTVTGNSIHYVLDPEGWPIDALPGLYGPGAFVRELERAARATRASARLGGEARNQFLFQYYNEQAVRLMDSVRSDAQAAVVRLPAEVIQRQIGGVPARGTITPPPPTKSTAIQAMPRAMTKMMIEDRLVREVTNNITYRPGVMQRAINEDGWAKIAGLHLPDARMDAASIALLAAHNPHTRPAVRAMTAADTTGAGGRFARAVANLERTMALDTVRNQYLMRPVLLRWLISGAGLAGVEEFNRRVYAELFLTPDSDPWLGLAAPDSYTALLDDGLVTNR
ncbi:MAG TPA: hypothetical protein VF240_08920 [Pyrinomonadaceae bacterium]